jgi:hypothetical protein
VIGDVDNRRPGLLGEDELTAVSAQAGGWDFIAPGARSNFALPEPETVNVEMDRVLPVEDEDAPDHELVFRDEGVAGIAETALALAAPHVGRSFLGKPSIGDLLAD